ncbi:hypothetical protein [Labedaea rhizosphaerae]|uniref:Uncharacterized protein n=1 Tax=Labedaea rhizosphaerae TaxID=598644 RepID=A0A4R6SJ16_LABRH|nr:hypothetical protein [Labedaea rhizosphaerae]TDQ00998.1 hypothetical protein EV186_102865 [Labedaea rhizosphaerae]
MTTEPAPAPVPTSTSTSRVPLYLAAGIGLVVGALVVGLLWLTVGGSDDDAIGGGGSAPITAPAKVGEYQRFAEVPGNASGPGKATAERMSAWDSQTAQRISTAYDGAAATVQTYAKADLSVIFQVQVVRANAPGLYVPYQDPKTLGLAEPQQDVKTFGAVQCIVHVQARAAESESPTQVVATDCQRTGGGLTVRVPTAGGTLGEHPDQVAAVVDEVFTAIR